MIDSDQTITSHGELRLSTKGWNEQLIEDYQGKFSDIIRLLALVNNGELSPILGTGNPNGVVTSNYSLKYIDTAVPTEYYNTAIGLDTGWIAL